MDMVMEEVEYWFGEMNQIRKDPQFAETMNKLEVELDKIVKPVWGSKVVCRSSQVSPRLFDDASGHILGGPGATYSCDYDMFGLGGVPRDHYNQYYGKNVPGWNSILQGACNGVIPEGYMMAWGGLTFLKPDVPPKPTFPELKEPPQRSFFSRLLRRNSDKASRENMEAEKNRNLNDSQSLLVDRIRWEIADQRSPCVHIEELFAYDKPTIMFRKGFIIPEEHHFLLRGFFETGGWQRIIPLGRMAYRYQDDMLTE